jgi:CheY-like chemotaxis protein
VSSAVTVTTLLVEDDQHKLDKLSAFMREGFPRNEIRVARSYQNALKVIRDWRPVLVILDMSLPTYEDGGGRPRPFAGKELLHEVKRRSIPSIIIIVTQFESFGEGAEKKTLEQLRGELTKEYRGWYRGIVYYNPAEDGWRDALKKLIEKAEAIL